MHRSCVEDVLVLAVIGRCALLARLGDVGGRIQTGLGQLEGQDEVRGGDWVLRENINSLW